MCVASWTNIDLCLNSEPNPRPSAPFWSCHSLKNVFSMNHLQSLIIDKHHFLSVPLTCDFPSLATSIMPHLWSRSPGHFRGYSTPKKIEEWNSSETRRNVLIYDLQWCLFYKTSSFWGTPTNYKIHQNAMISNPFAGWGSKPESRRSFDCSELTMKRASVVHRAASCGGHRVMCS